MKKIKTILCSLTLLLAGIVMFGTKQDASAADTTLPQVQGVKQTQTIISATNNVSITWNAVRAPSEYNGKTVYYKVEYREKKTPEVSWSTNTEAWTGTNIGNLSAGKSYEVRVSAYIVKQEREDSALSKSEKIDIASASTPIEVVTAPAQDSKFSFKQTKASANSVTISFSAVTGANYYEVGYMSSNMSSYKTVTTNKTTVTLKKLSKNTLTDVYVIPCRKSDAGDRYIAKSTTKVSGEVALVPSKPSVKYVRVDKSKKEMNIYPKDKSGRYADGFQYQIYRVYKNKKLASKTSERGSYYTYSNKAIGSRDLFKVRVRAYKVSTDGKKFYSDWSSWNYCSDYKTVKSVKSKGASGIEVKWNKVRGAKGYKIYAAKKNGDDSYKVVATIKNGNTTRATFNKLNKKALKKNQRYYVYVEPYFKSGDKTIKVNNGYYKYCTLIYKK